MSSVKDILFNRVKSYREQSDWRRSLTPRLQPHEMAVGSAEDLLVVAAVVRSEL